MAIITRCRMPPENSCGNAVARLGALGMPASANNAEYFPWSNAVVEIAHRRHRAAFGAKGDGEILDFEQWRRRVRRRGSHCWLRPDALGSSASRSASPTTLIDSTSTTSDAAGK